MIATLQRFPREHPRTVDTALIVLLVAISFPGSTLDVPGQATSEQWWPGVLLTCLACAALPWRRRRPRTVAVVTAALAVVVMALGYLPTVLVLGPLMVALYALAARTDRKTANTVSFSAVAVLVMTAVIAAPAHRSLWLDTASPAAFLLLSTALGTIGRQKESWLAAVRARAEHAERTREEEARQRVAEERVRIARELHDVVAHHLALSNAQAGTAAHLVRTRPEQAEKMLTELAGTTSAALRELKATVGLLRQADEPDAPLEPPPGLSRLPELTATLISAGLPVTVTVEGDRRPLSPGVDLTAYRIVQEALTNITKHAATSSARVGLTYSHDRLTITVTNDAGRPAATAPAAGPAAGSATSRGFGLIGMRERAQSVGGRLQAGRRPEGGFNVTAELPLHADGAEGQPPGVGGGTV